MQQGLGVAAGLGQALEHQVVGGLVGHAGAEVACHVLVQRVACVLAVHLGGHAREGFGHQKTWKIGGIIFDKAQE